jgi:hypothetical protein
MNSTTRERRKERGEREKRTHKGQHDSMPNTLNILIKLTPSLL